MKNELINLLNLSIDKFYENDHELASKTGIEQSCVFRIATYLDELIRRYNKYQNYNVDCEYNKNGNQAKITARCPKETRPDLIVHKRNSNKGNLLIAEFKCRKNYSVSKDIEKLEDFTKTLNRQTSVLRSV